MTGQLPMPPWGVGLSPSASKNLALLWDLAAQTDTPCANNQSEFVDYREPPSDEDAMAMCMGCPLLRMCATVAKQAKVSAGVWGGQVYDERE